MVRNALRQGLVGSVLAALVLGCGSPASPEPARPSPQKVVVIGWDGATWSVIDSLLQRGELPNLGRLIAAGGRGVMRADPPMFSPILWTTLATGFPAVEHGVTGFELPDPTGGGPVLAASFHRKRAALWQMVSAGGGSVGMVGWWATWPAEPVAGYLVSDHLAYNRWDDWAARAAKAQGGSFQLTWPEAMARELEPFAVRPDEVEAETLLKIAPFSEPERAEMMSARAPVKFHAPSVLRFGYATDASNQSFARHLLESRQQPDLFALVYILSDVAGHVFWHHYEPELYAFEAPDGDPLREALPNVYRQLDRWTGEILERIDPGSLVVVISDHGMAAKRMLPRPGINPSGDHIPDGVLIVSGSGIAAGSDLGTISQLDLAPTLLAALGLPVAADMPGHVVARALPEGRRDPQRTIETYGASAETSDDFELPPGADDYRARLRSLGYIN